VARRAFTLIEVLAVVALMGLLAGATVWSLAEDVRRSSHAEIVGRIINADHAARLAGQRLGEPCSLLFDLRTQSVRRVIGNEEGGRQTRTVLKLPPGYRIDCIVLPAAPGASRGPVVVQDSGEARIPFSTGGRSAAYALRLVSRDDSPGGNADGKVRQEWLVFAGLTGQMTVGLDDDQVNNLFVALEKGARPDAH
jgi:prepilin-type N-terminal cleavage/methylation domain-containing protein